MAKYRILSLDGGGLRGLITARLIARLNVHPQIAGWLDTVDLFAGTSTGGILALGLACGKTPEEICTLYRQRGGVIFDDSLWDNVRDLGKTVGADYSSKGLKAELKAVFGDLQLKDILRKVAIPTFDLDNEEVAAKRTWKPKIFHNFKGADSDGEQLVASIALYTSSAPTYFPSADGYIDGGVYANNPSIVALAQAISRRNQPAERAALDEVVMLSLGTGVSLTYIKGQALDWGYAQWAQPLINVLMDGVAGISDYQAQQLLDDRYHRLQIVFNPNETIALDAVDKLGRMDEIASHHPLQNTVDWIRTAWI
ncbi:patatin-like phospholipase family protein [Acidovorax sp. ACV01]|uniref:patatin-like phospholipase family protein n=1 Tax=Acidovorax sp. ACV01 TaxID=2769311 RepID=UPI0017807E6C|nr:patatin-like phospholipase family protein [Acidovorax sp. ACV01]MBD9395084.1 patatin-like phospholipase family protein [Acidovorax sp. ACV01]